MTHKHQPSRADHPATGGESGGAPYPNPHRGKKPKDGTEGFGGFMGHGGQSEQDYSGPGQASGEKADKTKSGRVGQGG